MKTPEDEAFESITLMQEKKQTYKFLVTPEQSDWQCYLFGNRPGSSGLIYRPSKGRVPNLFVRWMMRICLDSLWVKDKT